MKVIYDPETDTLSVHLSDATVADSDELRPGMILDFDAEGHIVTLKILDASRHMTVPPKEGLGRLATYRLVFSVNGYSCCNVTPCCGPRKICQRSLAAGSHPRRATSSAWLRGDRGRSEAVTKASDCRSRFRFLRAMLSPVGWRASAARDLWPQSSALFEGVKPTFSTAC